MLILWKTKEVKSTVKYNRLITLQHGHFRRVRRMKKGGVWRRLAGSLSGTRQIYLCGAVSSGLLAGQLMLGALINRLIMSGRSAEVGKAATDSNFRNKLYKEYDIKPEDFL